MLLQGNGAGRAPVEDVVPEHEGGDHAVVLVGKEELRHALALGRPCDVFAVGVLVDVVGVGVRPSEGALQVGHDPLFHLESCAPTWGSVEISSKKESNKATQATKPHAPPTSGASRGCSTALKILLPSAAFASLSQGMRPRVLRWSKPWMRQTTLSSSTSIMLVGVSS